jgi:hypothetical protein
LAEGPIPAGTVVKIKVSGTNNEIMQVTKVTSTSTANSSHDVLTVIRDVSPRTFSKGDKVSLDEEFDWNKGHVNPSSLSISTLYAAEIHGTLFDINGNGTALTLTEANLAVRLRSSVCPCRPTFRASTPLAWDWIPRRRTPPRATCGVPLLMYALRSSFACGLSLSFHDTKRFERTAGCFPRRAKATNRKGNKSPQRCR